MNNLKINDFEMKNKESFSTKSTKF